MDQLTRSRARCSLKSIITRYFSAEEYLALIDFLNSPNKVEFAGSNELAARAPRKEGHRETRLAMTSRKRATNYPLLKRCACGSSFNPSSLQTIIGWLTSDLQRIFLAARAKRASSFPLPRPRRRKECTEQCPQAVCGTPSPCRQRRRPHRL